MKVLIPTLASAVAALESFDSVFGQFMDLQSGNTFFGKQEDMTIDNAKKTLLDKLNQASPHIALTLSEAYVEAIFERANHDLNQLPPVVQEALGLGDGLNRSTLSCEDEDCTVPVNLEGLWGYGCWCHFGGNLMKGHGDPQNAHDQICMDLQNCLRCIQIDQVPAPLGGGTCDPKSATFNLGASFFAGQEALVTECGDANSGNDCGKYSCVCEMNFISQLVDKIFEGYVYDSQYKHDTNGGSWNFDDNCMTPTATAPKTKECCGNYPNRVPFYVENRSCCADTQELYSEVSHNCCADGVKPIGEVC